MAVSPFRVYSNAECLEVSDVLLERVNRWARRWFYRDVTELAFRNVSGQNDIILKRMLTDSEDAVLCGDTDSGNLVSLDCGECLLSDVASMMVRTEHAPDIAVQSADLVAIVQRDMVDACLWDLGDTLAGNAKTFGTQEPVSVLKALGDAARTGAGWGVLSARCGSIAVDVLLANSVLEGIVPPPVVQMVGGLAPVRNAIASQQARVVAALGRTTLTIGQFEKLEKGDVVKLDQVVLDPVRLLTVSGIEIAQGQLGSREGHKAVRLG